MNSNITLKILIKSLRNRAKKGTEKTTKTRPICMLPTRDSLQTHTGWKWGDGKRFTCKCKKENWSSNAYIRQIDFKIKTVTRENDIT